MQLLQNRILLLDKEETKKSIILLPNKKPLEDINTAKVLSIGNKVEYIKEGDIIMYLTRTREQNVEDITKSSYFINEGEVLLILEK